VRWKTGVTHGKDEWVWLTVGGGGLGCSNNYAVLLFKKKILTINTNKTIIVEK